MWRSFLAVLWLFALFFLPQYSTAAEEAFKYPVTRAAVLDVAKELYPPGSTDNVLADYSTWPTAVTLRAEIAQLLGEGMPKREVIDALVAKYGEDILAAPAKEGWKLAIWYLPFALITGGAVGLFFFIRKISGVNGSLTSRQPQASASEKLPTERLAEKDPVEGNLDHAARAEQEKVPGSEGESIIRRQLQDYL